MPIPLIIMAGVAIATAVTATGVGVAAATSKQESSADIIQKSLTKVLNEQITSINKKTTNESSIEASSKQIVKFRNIFNIGINSVKVSSDVNIKNMIASKDEMINDLTTKSQNDIESSLKASVEQANQGLTLGNKSNTSEINQDIQNYVRNTMQTDIKTAVNNILKSSATNKQEVTVTVGYSVGINSVTVDSLITMVANSISKEIMKSILQMKSMTAIKNEADAKVKQTNIGMFAGAGGCCCCILLILSMVCSGGAMMQSGGKRKMLK